MINPFPNKKYNIIYADPPWLYTSDPKAKRGIWGLSQDHYKSMSIKDLKELPVNDICEDNCILFMWATFPNLRQALDLVEAWGFTYKTVAFTWVKQNKAGTEIKKYGLGWYTRSNAEIVLIGRKGKFDRKSASVKQIILSPIEGHSKKPDEVRDRILELCGDLPRIELFAREKTEGWDYWGNDPKLSN